MTDEAMPDETITFGTCSTCGKPGQLIPEEAQRAEGVCHREVQFDASVLVSAETDAPERTPLKILPLPDDEVGWHLSWDEDGWCQLRHDGFLEFDFDMADRDAIVRALLIGTGSHDFSHDRQPAVPATCPSCGGGMPVDREQCETCDYFARGKA